MRPSASAPRYGPAVQIRPEVVGDRASIARVHDAAFDDDGVVAELVDRLRELLDARGGASLVADVDGEVVGHVMFTRSVLDAPSRLVDVQVLSPLGVLPAHQRHGVGAALVTAGLAAMDELGVPAVFLEGSPAYYPRFGFVAGAGLGFRKPSLRIPDAAFQVVCLGAHEPWMTGTLVYAHEFWDLDAVGLRDPDATGPGPASPSP